MLAGALISLGLIAIVMLNPNLAFYALLVIFLLIGVCTSTQIIGYPLVAENSKRIITAMSVSVVNISVLSGYAIFQPLFGYLLDKHVFLRLHAITTSYIPSDFAWAMWIFPIGFIVAVLVMFTLPETRCKQRVE
jgi:MFS family permease